MVLAELFAQYFAMQLARGLGTIIGPEMCDCPQEASRAPLSEMRLTVPPLPGRDARASGVQRGTGGPRCGGCCPHWAGAGSARSRGLLVPGNMGHWVVMGVPLPVCTPSRSLPPPCLHPTPTPSFSRTKRWGARLSCALGLFSLLFSGLWLLLVTSLLLRFFLVSTSGGFRGGSLSLTSYPFSPPHSLMKKKI